MQLFSSAPAFLLDYSLKKDIIKLPYRWGEIIVSDGLPQLVSVELFDFVGNLGEPSLRDKVLDY